MRYEAGSPIRNPKSAIRNSKGSREGIDLHEDNAT
jgi:hypothetical protein